VLRRIFGPKKDKVAGSLRTLHNEKVIKSRRVRWAGHVERMGEIRNSYNISVRKLEWKRPFGSSRRKMGR
jgi:hypothetical protein